MVISRWMPRPVLMFYLSVLTVALFIQVAAGAEYEPKVGQAGKDVIWVPTCQALVDKMLDMAKVTPEDYVIDLGSGDGRMVITAAKRGAQTLGIEYNPDLVALSKRNAVADGVGEKARFVHGDIFKTDFTQATVLMMFLLPELNLKLRPQILDMKPGTRVVSNSFDMGEWAADEVAEVDANSCISYNPPPLWLFPEALENRWLFGDLEVSYNTAYFWIVPAKVEGTWRLAQSEITLKQTFQTFSGTLNSDGKIESVTDGRLKGDEITFSVGGASYSGRVTGSTMEGAYRSLGSTGKWRATRVLSF